MQSCSIRCHKPYPASPVPHTRAPNRLNRHSPLMQKAQTAVAQMLLSPALGGTATSSGTATMLATAATTAGCGCNADVEEGSTSIHVCPTATVTMAQCTFPDGNMPPTNSRDCTGFNPGLPTHQHTTCGWIPRWLLSQPPSRQHAQLLLAGMSYHATSPVAAT